MLRRVRSRYAFAFQGFVALLAVGFFCVPRFASSVPPQEQQVTKAVRGYYENPWFPNDPSTPDWETSATMTFGGHIGPYRIPGTTDTAKTPTGGGCRLEMSSLGHPVARAVPYPDFDKDAIDRAGKMLYWEKADPTGVYARDKAAFRYKTMLYSGDVITPERKIQSALATTMADHYGTAEVLRSVEAERLVRNALKYAPRNRLLRNILLDIYYDRGSVAQIFAREKLFEAYKFRTVMADAIPPGEFVIDGEIREFEATLPMFDAASSGWFELLSDPLGVKTSEVDASATDEPPFGYYVFEQEVPWRSVYAATFQYDGGVDETRPVLDKDSDGEPDRLFSGYKDLVLFFNVERDRAKVISELCRRYHMRDASGDSTRALELIAQMQTTSKLDGDLLLGIFPDYTPEFNEASGLAEAIYGWRHGLTELSNTKDFITGKTNVLGFEEDFLVLIQDKGTESDSYDVFVQWLNDQSSGRGWVARAKEKLATARTSYDNYRDRQGDLQTELFRMQDGHKKRLFMIVGALPGQPGYDTPETNEGSDINLARRALDMAHLQIKANKQETENVIERIAIEVERRTSETGINASISQIYLDYGEEQAELTQEIHHWKAAQAAAEAAADGLQAAFQCSSLGLGIAAGIVGAVNAGAQAGFEEAIGNLEADKERLAGQEKAAVRAKEDELLQEEHEARIRTWALELRTLAIESEEALLRMKQEAAKLIALYDEKTYLEQRLAETNEDLAERYFADPIHRLRMLGDTVEAEMAFQEAQKWTYITARALEYKWNHPFIHTHEGLDWRTGSVFKLRNAEELESMVAAMGDWDAKQTVSITGDDRWDWFSVRKDFMGLVDDGTTDSLMEAIAEFRATLKSPAILQPNGDIVLRFGTNREIPGGTFFSGPRFDQTGAITRRGTWLDKIIWIKIRLPGNHTHGYTRLAGVLEYSGTAFVRNMHVGTSPERPDKVEGEMTAYTTRYPYYDPTAGYQRWRWSEALRAEGIYMQLTDDERVPPTVEEINEFNERSVAASEWTLWIPTKDAGVTLLDIDELNDVELYFYHQVVQRPAE